MDPEDAEQTAMIGLIEAARRFDPDRGFQFSSHGGCNARIGALDLVQVPKSAVAELVLNVEQADIDSRVDNVPTVNATLTKNNSASADTAQTLPEGASVAIQFVALASAAGVLLRQRWDWLALAAFAVSAPQWVVYLFDDAGPVEAIVTLTAFGGLGIALAVGHEIRARAESIRLPSAFLLALNALIVAGAGWLALETMGEPGVGKAWLVAVAAAHVAVGLAAPRLGPTPPRGEE